MTSMGHGSLVGFVAPLQEEEPNLPTGDQVAGVRLFVYRIPETPPKDPWPMEVIDQSLTHC